MHTMVQFDISFPLTASLSPVWTGDFELSSIARWSKEWENDGFSFDPSLTSRTSCDTLFGEISAKILEGISSFPDFLLS
jgi:hypothetical protein